MPLIQAWQCSHTGKFFADRDSYRKHLRRLAAIRLQEVKQRKEEEEFDAHIDILRKSGSFEQIAQWCMDNAVILARKNGSRRMGRSDRKTLSKVRLWDVEFEGMRWSNRCSNTHHAPAGKQTNWWCSPTLPRGYPGWQGTLAFKFSNYPGFISPLFQHTGIHLGGGGASAILDMKGREIGTKCHYGVTLFEEEWPILGLMMKMRGDAQAPGVHNF